MTDDEFRALVEAGPCVVMVAKSDMLRLLDERYGLSQLVDRMHAQDVAAVDAWQAAHPGQEFLWPGQTRLSGWMLGENANLRAEVAALRQAMERARGEALEEAAVIMDGRLAVYEAKLTDEAAIFAAAYETAGNLIRARAGGAGDE
jgi:hypothetical protein